MRCSIIGGSGSARMGSARTGLAGLDRRGLGWLDWIGPDWIGPDWVGPDWIGPDWVGVSMHFPRACASPARLSTGLHRGPLAGEADSMLAA